MVTGGLVTSNGGGVGGSSGGFGRAPGVPVVVGGAPLHPHGPLIRGNLVPRLLAPLPPAPSTGGVGGLPHQGPLYAIVKPQLVGTAKSSQQPGRTIAGGPPMHVCVPVVHQKQQLGTATGPGNTRLLCVLLYACCDVCGAHSLVYFITAWLFLLRCCCWFTRYWLISVVPVPHRRISRTEDRLNNIRLNFRLEKCGRCEFFSGKRQSHILFVAITNRHRQPPPTRCLPACTYLRVTTQRSEVLASRDFGGGWHLGLYLDCVTQININIIIIILCHFLWLCINFTLVIRRWIILYQV